MADPGAAGKADTEFGMGPYTEITIQGQKQIPAKETSRRKQTADHTGHLMAGMHAYTQNTGR